LAAANEVEVGGITKSFPGVLALDDVNVRVAAGSCHGLVGENGAGKSTLGKIISGLLRPDAGTILLGGESVRFYSPLDAKRVGIEMVHQELVFCENLSVAENLCLDAPPCHGPFVDGRETLRRAAGWLADIQADVDPTMRLGALPISKQQLVQIAGAVGKGAKVLIFDEPTSSLSLHETQILFDQIRKLLEAGVTCIYVSHRMDEVFELCDTVTVLRDGRVVGTEPIGSLSHDLLVRMMIGRDIEAPSTESGLGPPGDVFLKVEGLSSPGRFRDVSFSVRAGEIVGMAGLVGAGRTEIAEAIFGLDPNARGDVFIAGARLGQRAPAMVMKNGLGLVPEDRKRQGLVLGMNARENISLPTLRDLSRLGWVLSGRERALAERYFRQMQVKAPTTEALAMGLSGGNQQKLVMAKWLAADCDVLILDEPTRGVDVGAKAEIHRLIRDLAADGRAVLAISSELPELLTISTRILVIRNGRIAGELEARGATEEAVMRLMTGVEAQVD
jgi:ABC-type sugar transport system ATPase subunit